MKAQANIDQASVSRAKDFLKTESRGKSVLGSFHFGAQYKGHPYQQTLKVKNKPGDFALVYRYNWQDDGITDVAFLCDSKGYAIGVISVRAGLGMEAVTVTFNRVGDGNG